MLMSAEQELPVYTKETLVEWADKIDCRLGPISGRDADALARLLRATAARIQQLMADRDDQDRALADAIRARSGMYLMSNLRALKNRIDSRLDNHLCDMQEGYDDSIVGFNEAWDMVRTAFAEELGKSPMAEIKALADRFLAWPLPETFNPDGGISFESLGNKGTLHEYRRVPTGTNLLNADEARQMLEYLFGFNG